MGNVYANLENSESGVEIFEDTQRTQRQFSAKPSSSLIDKTRPDFKVPEKNEAQSQGIEYKARSE